MLVVNERVRVPLRELRFSFARSGGPGGQRLNKVATKAVLRWAVRDTPSLPDDVRARFLDRYRRRITREGDIIVTSQRFRDQGRNVADCTEKLRAMLEEVTPAPRRRRPTRPSRGARERRLASKRAKGETKQLRRTPSVE